MPLTADSILDRIKLKKSIMLWRSFAILAIVAILIIFSMKAGDGGINESTNRIARINIEGVIFEDPKRDEILKKVKENSHIKAVVVYINSPGGTIVGGENLYHGLREIAAVKPVVAVMGSLAASGGYMAAIAADRIYARAGTVTGSVGVLLQSFDVTELGNKMGIGFLTFKSGKLKATPSPFEKNDPETTEAINEIIADSFNLFLGMVVERRGLTEREITQVSDGRVFTGRQALEYKLIDEIGGQDEALKWLQDEKGIDKSLKVNDVKLDTEKKFVEKLMSKVTGGITPFATKNGGLMAIWN